MAAPGTGGAYSYAPLLSPIQLQLTENSAQILTYDLLSKRLVHHSSSPLRHSTRLDYAVIPHVAAGRQVA